MKIGWNVVSKFCEGASSCPQPAAGRREGDSRAGLTDTQQDLFVLIHQFRYRGCRSGL